MTNGGRRRPFHAAVTGLGLITSGGLNVADTWRIVAEGRSPAAADPALAGLPVPISCRAASFDADRQLGRKTAWRLDRFTQLAMVAAREAVADAGLDPSSWDGSRIGILLGTALGGTATWEREYAKLHSRGHASISPLTIPMAGTSMVAGYLAADLAAYGPNLITTTACASGATAIGMARELLRSGCCDIVLTGGVEASLSPIVVAAFAKMGALSTRIEDPAHASRPFDIDRDGFVIGEGAAILVMERSDHAAARGIHPYARISGYGASADAGHPTRPDPNGLGAERAIRAALDDACLGPADIDHVNAHGTSTPLNDLVEAHTIRRVLGRRPVVTSTKGVTGHCLGATGAIEAALTAMSLKRQTVPPTANLVKQDPSIELDVVIGAPRETTVDVAISNSFGFGGQNAVLVLTR